MVRRPRAGALAVCAWLLAAGWAAAASAPRALRVCDDVVPPASLDPLKEFSEKDYTIVQQIFDGLVRFDPEGRIVPALATSWRRVGPTQLEFSLRPGVTFHDGEPFDAQAVKFSIDEFVDPKSGFPGAGFLSTIAGVDVVGPLTVRVRTKSPDGILLNRLAALVPILPPRYIARKGEAYFARHPVGTGAFRFRRWTKEGIFLDANPRWWMTGFPKYGGLVFRFLPSREQVSALLDGRVDVVTELPGTDTLRVVRSGIAGIVKKETFYTLGSSVNVSTGPLADVRVRRALNYAIDREKLIRYDVLGNGRPLATLSMAGEIGHDPSLKPYPYDPERSRRLLAQAGYPRGVTLKVVVKAQGARTLKIIAAHLRRVGIRLEMTPTTDATVIRDIQRGGWDFTFGGCPDPLAHAFFVPFIFLSSLSPYSITRDPVFDRLLGKLAGTLDAQDQQRAGAALDRYVYDQALGVFTYQRLKTYGVRRGVHFVPWVTGMPYFYASWPDETASR